MKRFLSLVAALGVMLFTVGAVGPRQFTFRNGVLIAPVVPSTAQSFTYKNVQGEGGLGILTLYVKLIDANDSITSITMTCTGEPLLPEVPSPGDFMDQQLTCVSGVCYSNNLSLVAGNAATQPLNTAAAKYWKWRLDVEGENTVTCTFTAGGVVTNTVDLLSVYGRSATKGS